MKLIPILAKAYALNDSTLIFGQDSLVIQGTLNNWLLSGNSGTNPAGPQGWSDIALGFNAGGSGIPMSVWLAAALLPRVITS